MWVTLCIDGNRGSNILYVLFIIRIKMVGIPVKIKCVFCIGTPITLMQKGGFLSEPHTRIALISR